VLYGRPDDYPQQRADRISGLTLDALKRAIGTVQPGALTWIIIGDLSKIEKPVRGLELGDLKVVDADGKVLR
jgi:zinc protease